jgi:hypothetical protein
MGSGRVSIEVWPNDDLVEVREMAPVWRVSRKRWLCE